METGLSVFYQIMKMFIMMMVGYGLYKKKMINEDTTAKLSNILLMVATPCTIVTSFNQVYSAEKMQGLIIAFILSFLVYAVNILAARTIYHHDQRIERFSVVFSNAGFMGIPLVTGLLGAEAVFYLSPFIVCFYLFAWTYGVIEMTGNSQLVTVKKILTNPCVWAVVIGVIIFMIPNKPFAFVMESVSMLGSMNTPLAMIVLGAYLAKVRLKDIFLSANIYFVCIFRLIIMPVLYLFLFAWLDFPYEIKMTIYIGASAPVGVLVPMFAQMFGRDIGYGAKIVSLSTLLSLISLPLVLMLPAMFW